MLKKALVATLSIISCSVFLPVYANEDLSCKVEVAVATPPVQFDQNVAFNVTNEFGFARSLTMLGGKAPQSIDKIPCSPAPLTISATLYTTPLHSMFQGPIIGQCVLKAGPVILNGPDNSVSVVFPNDFNCN
ncbi:MULTISPECIES: hypothetical protein [Legionella]|uniref:Uncharacterized protein n=1 Tax=Legionella steelei TaxID=947033 RepID=A0A0W0ZIP2_9GAMM|nr:MULTISPECIES: hypothetical protein [Legionella]KTD69135.1 hypothetical protein Lste_2293 [Legionella steelei]MBN9225784.1 hypothetical protein [Legionella steelei]OJW10607.1 MAG: hypothetical protein BGO44_05410 [Legionella sp. 39-23]